MRVGAETLHGGWVGMGRCLRTGGKVFCWVRRMVRGLVGPTNTNTTHRPQTFQCEAMRVNAKPLQSGCVGHQKKKKNGVNNKYVLCAKKKSTTPDEKIINNNAHQQPTLDFMS